MTHRIEDVVARGMCVGCGACAVRTGGAISVTLGRYGVYGADLSAASETDRRAGGSVCPLSDESPDEDELAAEHFGALPIDDRIGRVLSLHAGRVLDDGALVESSSGGLTSWTLSRLLERGVADAVIHVGRTEDGRFGYVVSRSVEQQDSRRKSIYTSSTLDQVLSSIRGDGLRYILVGVPCFIRAARALARQDAVLSDQLVYFVGLVCGHLKSAFFAESLAWQAVADVAFVVDRDDADTVIRGGHSHARRHSRRRSMTRAVSGVPLPSMSRYAFMAARMGTR